ncbi:MIZ zinc finger family protein [Histomonas meleagridis]|uniref:MIZ zinc finger family protein n=1 Tax=Histomonas meleagridis TaxID=135588 RepID=UPI00355A7E70|nr:MIZ zinc finger family protein [Histomonas meleagridis]KAH0798808.1 MIZ zinc finger family protein [Histomonas meleagridis]
MENNYNFGQPNINQFQTNRMVGNEGAPSLSPEQFDTLIKSIQLLRISQLRYIVQKFSIPASGNKTKLLSLVIKIFHGLRYDKSLIDVFNEVNRLLVDQQDPLASSPLNSFSNNLVIGNLDPNYLPITNPLYEYLNEPPFFGPILVSPGQSSGKFTFVNNLLSNSMMCLTFYFNEGKPHAFSLNGNINGAPFEVFPDDPYPQPIDITGSITAQNVLEVRIQTSSSMMICLNRYQYNGIQFIADQICHRHVNLSTEKPTVIHLSCTRQLPFPLGMFLSKAVSTDNWRCPICNEIIEPSQIALSSDVLENEVARAQCMFSFENDMTVDLFSQQQNDIFNIDWEGFAN